MHGPADVDAACATAEEAFDVYRATSREERAAFLDNIGAEIMAIGDDLIQAAMRESGLPRARLEGERGRTVGQLGLFAKVLRAGAYLQVRIDPAMPDRQPLPRPDLRLRMVPLGPVAVFGASNFPLAFDRWRRHRFGAGRRLPGRGEGPSRPSADRRAGRRCHRARGRSLRPAQGRVQPPDRPKQRAGRRFGPRSAYRRRRLHRLARRWSGAGQDRAGTPRSDPRLCRNVQHQPGRPDAGSVEGAARRSAPPSSVR